MNAYPDPGGADDYGAGDHPEWAAAARRAYLARMARIGRGWHDGGWQDPARRLLELEARYADPAELRQLAYDRTRTELLNGHLALLLLGVRRVGHEPGRPA